MGLDLDAIEAKITPGVIYGWPRDLADFAEAMISDVPAMAAEIRRLREPPSRNKKPITLEK
jgi:hypothetical protein